MRNRARLLVLGVLIGLLALAAGCGSPTTQPSLDGTKWKLTSWAEPDPIPASATITAEFADDRVAGSAGVNRYNASVTASSDGSLSFGEVISTKMAGPPEAMAAEAAYLKRLQAATSYRVDGDQLVINDADGEPSLTFTSA